MLRVDQNRSNNINYRSVPKTIVNYAFLVVLHLLEAIIERLFLAASLQVSLQQPYDIFSLKVFSFRRE